MRIHKGLPTSVRYAILVSVMIVLASPAHAQDAKCPREPQYCPQALKLVVWVMDVRVLVWPDDVPSPSPPSDGPHAFAGPEEGNWVIRLYAKDPNASRAVYFEIRAPGPSPAE